MRNLTTEDLAVGHQENTEARRQRREAARRRRATRDTDSPHCGFEKAARMDLGIELLRARALPGQVFSTLEIAAWAGCTDAAIWMIEKRALRKLRMRISPELREAIAA